jgi:hypothetical protein
LNLFKEFVDDIEQHKQEVVSKDMDAKMDTNQQIVLSLDLKLI